jgi:aspartate/methionine/tyrosine aminotransferase
MSEIRAFFVMEILARARELERQGRSIVHMEIGEPDFPTPPLVSAAALDFIGRGEVKYTPAGGLPELREAISRHYLDRYAVKVESDRIFITPGASGALQLALGILPTRGTVVAVADPGYPCHANLIRLFSGVPQLIPVTEATDFGLSPDLLNVRNTKDIGGLIVASPGNPTGSIMQAEALRQLARFAADKRMFLIADEIYHGLEYGKPSPSILGFSDRAFVVNSFSKYFGMTGWRLGWLIVPREYIGMAERLAQNMFISAPTHSQYAALASFHTQNLLELERRRRIFKDRRDSVSDALRRLGFSIRAKAEGAFYIYADCSALTEDSMEFSRELLEHAGVAVTPGVDFGENLPERHIRFSYTTETESLREGTRRIAEFLGEANQPYRHA